MRLSLQTKTILGIATTALLLLLVLVVLVFNLLNDLVENSVKKSAETSVSLFVSATKNAFLSYDLASLEADVAEILTNPNIAFVRVKDKYDRIYVEKGEVNAINRPFREDSSVLTARDGIYDARAPIMVDSTLYGYVEIGLNIASVTDSVSRVRKWTLTIAFIEFILIGVCSAILGSYLMSQLKRLHQGALHLGNAIDKNDYKEVFITVKGDDELSDLAEAFNQLVEKLKEENEQRQQAQEDLTELNALLEVKVKDRTALLHRRNAQLEEANKNLKETQVQLLQAEKMASVGQLAAGVAHEINNPIGFVSSNVATLSDYVTTYQTLFATLETIANTEDKAKQQSALMAFKALLIKHDMAFINADIGDLLNDSQEGLQRVADIVKGLKLFSRIDTDEMQQHNLNDCVKTTLAMVNNELKYTCTVQTQLGDIPEIAMNVGKVSQVITNLLINAGQAIESTGKQGTITITTKVEGDFVMLVITDTGCGIDPSHLDKLFNPFFTTKPEGQGTGLGLSISYGIAQEHGGTLSASSDGEKGSCFELALPLVQKEQSVNGGRETL